MNLPHEKHCSPDYNFPLNETQYDYELEGMLDSVNIYVLLEIYKRETAKTPDTDFPIRLGKYLKKHGVIA